MKTNHEKIDRHLVLIQEEMNFAIQNNESLEAIELLKSNIQFLNEVKAGSFIIPDVAGILKSIANIDLTTFPYSTIKPLIEKLGMVPSMSKFLYPGNGLIRARLYEKGEKTFTKLSDLSFKPAELNTTYQRASTPNQTVFYGTIANPKDDNGQFDSRLAGTLESMKWIHDPSVNRIQRIAFGRWDTTSKIRLNAVIHHTAFHPINFEIKEMYDEFNEFIQLIPEMQTGAAAIADFFSARFADKEACPEKSHLYMLSAMWAEASINAGLDGVLYPSVQSDGEHFCVALAPTSCTKMRLSVAGESTIFKYKKQVIMTNELICELNEGDTIFEMKPVEAQFVRTEKQVLEAFGLENFNELEDKR